MAFYTPPPLQTPPADIRTVAQSAASACPTLAPAATREQQAVNLLFETKCRLDLRHDIATPQQQPDGSTLYSFENTTFFQIIAPKNKNETITITGHVDFLEAIRQTLGVDTVNIQQTQSWRGGKISLTPQQFKTLYQQRETFIKNFEALEEQREGNSGEGHRSEAPSQEQPPILALWNLGENTRS